MKWINVQDSLPDSDRLEVLICDENLPGSGSISSQYSAERREFFNMYGSSHIKCDPVTHWMEMPFPVKSLHTNTSRAMDDAVYKAIDFLKEACKNRNRGSYLLNLEEAIEWLRHARDLYRK